MAFCIEYGVHILLILTPILLYRLRHIVSAILSPPYCLGHTVSVIPYLPSATYFSVPYRRCHIVPPPISYQTYCSHRTVPSRLSSRHSFRKREDVNNIFPGNYPDPIQIGDITIHPSYYFPHIVHDIFSPTYCPYYNLHGLVSLSRCFQHTVSMIFVVILSSVYCPRYVV